MRSASSSFSEYKVTSTIQRSHSLSPKLQSHEKAFNFFHERSDIRSTKPLAEPLRELILPFPISSDENLKLSHPQNQKIPKQSENETKQELSLEETALSLAGDKENDGGWFSFANFISEDESIPKMPTKLPLRFDLKLDLLAHGEKKIFSQYLKETQVLLGYHDGALSLKQVLKYHKEIAEIQSFKYFVEDFNKREGKTTKFHNKTDYLEMLTAWQYAREYGLKDLKKSGHVTIDFICKTREEETLYFDPFISPQIKSSHSAQNISKKINHWIDKTCLVHIYGKGGVKGCVGIFDITYATNTILKTLHHKIKELENTYPNCRRTDIKVPIAEELAYYLYSNGIPISSLCER